MTDQLTRALSARIRYAAILIRKSRFDDALLVLEQCERVLPLPSRTNWQATKDIVDRHYKNAGKTG